MLKGNNNLPWTVTRIYDTIKRFESAAPRQHCTGSTGNRGNRNNHGGRGGQYHTLVENTAPSGNVFFQILKTAHHIAYSVSIVKSEAIMKTNAQKQHAITLQKTKEATWHRLEGVSLRVAMTTK